MKIHPLRHKELYEPRDAFYFASAVTFSCDPPPVLFFTAAFLPHDDLNGLRSGLAVLIRFGGGLHVDGALLDFLLQFKLTGLAVDFDLGFLAVGDFFDREADLGRTLCKVGYFDLLLRRFHLEVGFAFDDGEVPCFAAGVIAAGRCDQDAGRADVQVIAIGDFVVLILDKGHSPDLDVHCGSAFLSGVCILRLTQSQLCF